MALVPVAEILLRALLRVGISGAASFTQHFALIAGMLGAAVAAREQRLLSLSTLDSLLVGRGALLARFFTRTVAVIVGALLCLASVELVLAERAGGNVTAYASPVWLGQAALPLGFALITLRLAWSAGVGWPARLASLALAAAVAAAAASRLPLGNAMAITAVCVVLVAAILGSPVFTTLGGVALFLFWSDGLPIASIPLDHYRLVVNPSLPMIPLFTLAGYFLAEGGAPRRLIRVFDALFGGLRGGAATATVLACAFFTSFSGASGVTIIALGGMLMPLLLSAGYSQKNALGLLTGAGSLGGMLPPGLPLVLYAIVARVSIEEMFLAGILPGLLLLGVALGFTNYLVDARIPERAVDWVTGVIHSRWMFLVALNLFLLVAGCLLDIFSATVVLVPLIVPLGLAFGIDPIHLGIVFLVNMELGYLTPPVGMNLFFAAYRFGKPLPEVCRAALPVVGVLAVGVLLVAFVPWLASGLPRLLK